MLRFEQLPALQLAKQAADSTMAAWLSAAGLHSPSCPSLAPRRRQGRSLSVITQAAATITLPKGVSKVPRNLLFRHTAEASLYSRSGCAGGTQGRPGAVQDSRRGGEDHRRHPAACSRTEEAHVRPAPACCVQSAHCLLPQCGSAWDCARLPVSCGAHFSLGLGRVPA